MAEEELLPQVFQHCRTVYDAMRADARIRDDSEGRFIVWEGFLTKLVEGVGLAMPYYTEVRKHLIRMGCLRQLRRGGGSTPSQWEVIRRPTRELFLGAIEELDTRVTPVQQQIADLAKRIETLERQQDVIIGTINGVAS